MMQLLKEGAERLGLRLTDGQLQRFAVYCRGLATWNQVMNLTAITDCAEVQVKHFLDSLTVALVLEPGRTYKLVIRAPEQASGLPLKIWFPSMKLTLLEATGKKTRFLSALVEKLALEGVAILNARAEEAAHETQYREAFDVVVARGLAPMPVLAELTLPLCRVGASSR